MADMKQTSDAFDTRAFRNALGLFATGVTVMTVLDNGRLHGMTANAFVSVSLAPPLVLVSADHRSNMHQILQGVDRYGVSVLAEDQEQVSKHFAGKPQKGLDVPFVTHDGVPLVDGALAQFVVHIVDAHVAGDHTLYIGEVEHFEARGGCPLLFYAGQYRSLPPE